MCSESILSRMVAWKEFFPAFTIVANVFAWYAIMSTIFPEIVSELPISNYESLVVLSFYFLGIASSAFVGATLIHSRNRLLSLWMLMGTVASLLLLAIDSSLPLSAFLVALFLGISTGVGLPSCLAYFADSTSIENRGMFGGITWSAAGVTILVLAIIMSMLDSFCNILILTLFRGVGLITFILVMKKESTLETHAIPSYTSILSKRTLLYLVPWIMFCLVNWMEAPIVENLFGEFFIFAGYVEFAITGVAALLGGIFSDWVGRKRLIITGFVILGINYALLSLLPATPISWYVYIVVDGITWGMFAVIFFIVLWGDLAEKAEKERFYLIGGLPYLLAGFLSILVRPFVGVIPANSAFSIASFFLFIAVLPLLYAPETVPAKKLRERELKKYAEAAVELKEKSERKSARAN